MKILYCLLLIVIVAIGSAVTVMFSGIVDVAADEPHSDWVYRFLEETRKSAIGKAAENIVVPDLSDPELLLSGGLDYEFMCASCHLKPGQTESDLSVGLYPAPPNLALSSKDYKNIESQALEKTAREHFWVIKHGIKASGMPAWGKTHDDKRIWAMVAFIKKLPSLSPEHYQILTAID